jgi:hypothetical protein
MNAGALARDVSNARTLAYWLLAHDRIGSAARAVDGLDSELLCIQGELDDPHGNISACGLKREVDAVEAAIAEADPVIEAQLRMLVLKGRGLQRTLASGTRQSGKSGIRRAVREPKPVLAHFATMDASARREALSQATAVVAGSTLLYAKTGRARAFGAALGASRVAMASVLSGAERPRQADWIWGATAILAPFVLGYIRRDPLVAAAHVVAGLGAIASTLRIPSTRQQASRTVEATPEPELLAVGL